MNELQDFNYIRCLYENDNLPDVFGTVLNTFPNITGATVTGMIYLWELLQKIKYNFAEDIDVEHLLTDKYIDGLKNPVYDEKKKQLPAVCYNAVFNEYKNIDNVKHVTNLMFLDIDDFGSYDEVVEYKNYITQKYDWIVACNLSLSRLGLHVIILVDNINGNNDFNRKYEYISSAYFDEMLDPYGKSLSRYAVIPADYNIYINENPNILEIDKIFNKQGQGIRSPYNTNNPDNVKGIFSVYNTDSEDNRGILSVYNINTTSQVKSICSVYNTNDEQIEEGIRSVYREKEEIYTPYTLFSNSSLNQLMNDSARKQNLIFRQTIDESYFKNVDIPLYISEGIELMEVNLFAFKDKKIREGKGTSAKRISLLGATTVKLIYLNAVNSVTPIKELRRAILKFIVSINKKYCEPPVPHREVLNSFNANWKKFKAGELDFSMYLSKRRAFWSKLTTLSSNEKRKITCAIKNEPIVAESKRKILEAIVHLHSQGEKITQKKVGSMPGLTLPLVKKYRKYFNVCRDAIVASSVNNEANEIPEETSIKHHMEVAQNIIKDDCLSVLNVPIGQENASEATHEDFLDFDDDEDTLIIENYTPRKLDNSYVDYTDEQLQVIFDRIYNSVKSKITPEQNKELYNNFWKEIRDLSVEEKKIMSMRIDDITDSGMFFKQVNLDLKFLNLCAEMLQ